MNETDDLDLFLQTWEPGERLIHASLPQNLHDPFITKKLLDDGTDHGELTRSAYLKGPKVMASEELFARAYTFFEGQQASWAAEFRDYVLERNVPESKLNTFIRSFAQVWIDGRKRRQDSPEMLAIKASVRDYDQLCHSGQAGRFVINQVDCCVPPLFTPCEMAAIFEANCGLIAAYLPDYFEHLGNEGPGSLGDVYVRRGVYLPSVEGVRRELHYLSSYSLTLGPVEQFASTWTSVTRAGGEATIFSAPLPAIQNRIVAFAPFVEGMDLTQLEFVVAPPVEVMSLYYDGKHGGIHEYRFE